MKDLVLADIVSESGVLFVGSCGGCVRLDASVHRLPLLSTHHRRLAATAGKTAFAALGRLLVVSFALETLMPP
jgi:hypothetical protein